MEKSQYTGKPTNVNKGKSRNKGKPTVREESQKSGIGLRIQELRIRDKITTEKLAEELNCDTLKCSTTTLNRWEIENSAPVEAIEKIAKKFGVSCDWIITGISPENLNAHAETGLSEKALNVLHDSKVFTIELNQMIVQADIREILEKINLFVSNPYFHYSFDYRDPLGRQLPPEDMESIYLLDIMKLLVQARERRKEWSEKT